MNKKLAKAEYIISDNGSGIEINVRLEIDYEAKIFRVKSARKDGSFVFTDNFQSPERVISIGNAIRMAAEFAKIELSPESSEDELEEELKTWITPKETIEAFTQ